MRQRPLRLTLAHVAPRVRPGDLVRHQGLRTFPRAVRPETASELLRFLRLEHATCLQAVRQEPLVHRELFSEVQRPEQRWDLRLPMAPVVYKALGEALGGDLGDVLQDLVGADAELWELGAVTTEPGAEPQAVHCDAPRRCALALLARRRGLRASLEASSPASWPCRT